MVAMSRACSILTPFSPFLDGSEPGAGSCPRAGAGQNSSTGAELGITSVPVHRETGSCEGTQLPGKFQSCSSETSRHSTHQSALSSAVST